MILWYIWGAFVLKTPILWYHKFYFVISKSICDIKVFIVKRHFIDTHVKDFKKNRTFQFVLNVTEFITDAFGNETWRRFRFLYVRCVTWASYVLRDVWHVLCNLQTWDIIVHKIILFCQYFSLKKSHGWYNPEKNVKLSCLLLCSCQRRIE